MKQRAINILLVFVLIFSLTACGQWENEDGIDYSLAENWAYLENEESTNDLLVACYAIGCSIAEEEIEEYPHLRFAAGESDAGVIVSFNSEVGSITDSLIIPAGTKTMAINLLNWQTDSTPAGKEENPGSCFTNYDGEIEKEIEHLTGAYIDPKRGALKVPVPSDMYLSDSLSHCPILSIRYSKTF